MNIHDFLNRVRELAPERLASPWDNSGVQVAGPERTVSKAAVSLEPGPEALAKALDWGAEVVVTHHPLYLKPEAPNTPSRYLDALRLLLCSETWLYSAHTSLDSRPGGPARWLGEALGLRDRAVLEPQADPEAGFGELGDLPRVLSVEAFLKKLQPLVGGAALTLCGPEPRRIRRVAYCPGSGSSLAALAFGRGADVLVTGDVKYHAALEVSGLVVDVGHFALEEEMMRRFAAELARAAEGVSVRFFEGRDPFRRVPGRE